MRQNLNRPKQLAQPKKATQFSIDMDIKGVVVFLVLVILTAATVFYLGVIIGKATRDPNAPMLMSNQSEIKIKQDNESRVQKNLKIYDIRDESNKISTIKKDTQKIIDKANRVINETKQEEEKVQRRVRAKKEKVVAQKTPVKKKFEPTWPGNESAKKDRSIYTLQILATKSMEHATNFVKQLKRKGYGAYMVDVSIEGTKIYRIRVGKSSRSEIQKLQRDMKKVVEGIGSRPRIIKIK